MSTFRTWTRRAAIFAAACLVLTLGAAPVLVSGADHLDAPALGGLTNAAGQFDPHSEHGDRDINDVYVFQGSNATRTVLAMTTNPAINLFGGHFGTNVRYILNVDRNGDAVQDLSYVARFGAANASGVQSYTVTRYTGANARTLRTGLAWASGSTASSGIGKARDGGKVFAGVRSDPFFFDLTGFVGSVGGVGTDRLGQDPTDFFAPLNTNAIVLEVPDSQLGTTIGVWGQTTWRNGSTGVAADQMGRPAINTVFNPSADKNAFNATPPSQQRTAMGGKFRTNVISVLKGFSALDSEGAYSDAQAGGLADILLPDVITYDTTTAAAGPLNGRALADDVIDAELNIVTGGVAFAGRNTVGAITGDGVGPHTDYLSAFPYLGVPH
jgi:hypothetical protein